jgi:hypothetical protein
LPVIKSIILLVLPFLASVATPGHADSNVLLSLGRVLVDEPVYETIVFNNPTKNTLQIRQIESTPPLSTEEVTQIVPPGGEGSFVLVLGEDRTPGAFSGSIRIGLEDSGQRSIVFDVEGFIVPPLEFDPMPAFLVATHAGVDKSASLEIFVRTQGPLAVTGAEVNSDRYTLDLETVDEGKHYRLNLHLDGSATPGGRSDLIRLHTDPPLYEPVAVHANTMIRERIYHFPDSVDLGSLPLTVAKDQKQLDALSQTLMIYRPGTSDFEAEASSDSDFLDVSGERGPDGDRVQFTVTLVSEKLLPGKIDGFLTIKTNDPEFDIFKVPVSGYVLDTE